MAIKKADTWRVWEDSQVGITLSSTSDSTASKTVKAFITDEDGTEILIGTASGAAAGTSIVITLDFSTAGVTASKWYTLRVGADLDQTVKIGMLPNPNTADKIRIFIRPIPTNA